MEGLNMDTAEELSHIADRDTTCFDCGAADTDWASLGFGNLVCLTCAGFHRSLGTHITSVRALKLDSWSPDQVKILELGGNDNFNNYIANLQLSESMATTVSKYGHPRVLYYRLV
jgi:hypothetical protein